MTPTAMAATGMTAVVEILGGERYFAYVAAAYGATALTFLWAVARTWWTARARRRRLVELEGGGL